MSASIGGGHNAAADEITRRLRAAGLRADRHEFLEMFPARLGAVLRRVYALELAVAPDSWGWLCAVLRRRAVLAVVAVLTTLLTGRAMRRRIGTAAAVVSTYPLANQVLGRLRRTGRLDAPALTYLTDVSVHPLWIAPGVDTHLAAHQITARQADALGAHDVRRVAAAVRPAFRHPTHACTRSTARQRFGLPTTGRLALVAGGAWGVGDVERTARDIAATDLATPVVVCATNTALRHVLHRADIGIALAWVDDMATLMRACDVVVTNGGGITSIEATELGVPVLIYRELPGHGRTNAAAFQQAGLAQWIRSPAELAAALATPPPPRTGASTMPDPAAVVAAATGQTPGRPACVAARRRRRLAVAAAMAVGACLATSGTAVTHDTRTVRTAVTGPSGSRLVVGPSGDRDHPASGRPEVSDRAGRVTRLALVSERAAL